MLRCDKSAQVEVAHSASAPLLACTGQRASSQAFVVQDSLSSASMEQGTSHLMPCTVWDPIDAV